MGSKPRLPPKTLADQLDRPRSKSSIGPAPHDCGNFVRRITATKFPRYADLGSGRASHPANPLLSTSNPGTSPPTRRTNPGNRWLAADHQRKRPAHGQHRGSAGKPLSLVVSLQEGRPPVVSIRGTLARGQHLREPATRRQPRTPPPADNIRENPPTVDSPEGNPTRCQHPRNLATRRRRPRGPRHVVSARSRSRRSSSVYEGAADSARQFPGCSRCSAAWFWPMGKTPSQQAHPRCPF